MPSLGLVVEDELRVPDADDLKGARMPVRQHFLAQGDDGNEYERSSTRAADLDGARGQRAGEGAALPDRQDGRDP